MRKTKYLGSILLFLLFCNCQNNRKQPDYESKQTLQIKEYKKQVISLEEAYKLSKLPADCIKKEYPNKLNQTLEGAYDLKSPKELHPAFYGCFDWHSSVHGHWSLVSLLKQFPNLENRTKIEEMLLSNSSEENIKVETEYFNSSNNQSFERTYGWAWLLNLAEELHTWKTPIAKELEANLKPLTDLIVAKYFEFLPKLNYPIRVGEHTNTAFGLSFAYDYAQTVNHNDLKLLIEERFKDFFLNDRNCPMSWEPSGFDFLSPCLEEAALIKRILPKDEYKGWLEGFLPRLKNNDFQLETGMVSDSSDGKLVHLDGVNFSRAWSLYKISENLPNYDHLRGIANQHVDYSMKNIVGDSYEGGHWLSSFAIYAINSASGD